MPDKFSEKVKAKIKNQIGREPNDDEIARTVNGAGLLGLQVDEMIDMIFKEEFFAGPKKPDETNES